MELDVFGELHHGDRLEQLLEGDTHDRAAEVGAGAGGGAVDESDPERRRAFDAAVRALVRDAVDAGEVRSDVDPALAARLLSGTINSIVEWYRPGRPGTATLPEDVVRAAFSGIVPAP